MAVVSLLTALYYNVIVAWVLFYLFYSLRAELPWSNCRHDWNTEHCFSNLEETYCKQLLNDNGARFYNRTCWSNETADIFGINETLASLKKKPPSDEFYNIFMLNTSDSFDDIGTLQWPLVVSLAVAWILVFVCLSKGIQSTGKAVYVTATFPYVVLLILLIRGVTLEGAVDGIRFYVTPNFTKLATVDPWIKAATQVFYSLGPAFGGIITMSSYMPFTNNCQRDAIIVSIVDSMTSMFAGCAIFSVMGFMAHDLGVPVDQVTQPGPGLAFIAYPEAIVRMPLSPIWSVLFFVMMILLGLDSEFSTLETCTTAIIDEFPVLRRFKTLVIFIMCCACFLIGLIFCTNGGIYYFTAFDDYSGGYCVLIIAICECLVVSYVYGIKRFMNDICAMLGWKPNVYWIFTWCFGAPVYMFCVLVFMFIKTTPSEYNDYIFHGGAEVFCWILSILSIMWIPILGFYQILKACRDKKHWRFLFQSSHDYGPAKNVVKKNSENIVTITKC